MAVNHCRLCTAPAGDTYLLCAGCGDRISRALADTPDLLDELDTTRLRQDHLTPTTQRRHGGATLPWKEPAAHATAQLAATLRRWAAEIPVDPATIPTAIGDLARWLHPRVNWLRAHDNAADAVAEITGAVAHARTVIDLPATSSRFQVGPCPEITDDGQCDGTVWATIATRGDDTSLLRCHTCDARWNTTQWLRVGRLILARARQLQVAA